MKEDIKNDALEKMEKMEAPLQRFGKDMFNMIVAECDSLQLSRLQEVFNNPYDNFKERRTSQTTSMNTSRTIERTASRTSSK